MTKKKDAKNENEKYDQHIVDALLKLKMPIKGCSGKEFDIRSKGRNENGLEHIALKRHRLKVKDIEMIPDILKHPNVVTIDPHNRNYRNYYGIRKGKDAELFLKIVTWPYESDPNKETIITIYPTSRIKIV